MSFNSSNVSLLPPHLSSSNSSLYPTSAGCIVYKSTFFIFTMFSVTNILLILPLCILVFFLGLQRWLRQRSTSAAVMTSHSDVFTYHMVAIEMFGIFGCGLFCCGMCFNVQLLITWGMQVFSYTTNGQFVFHILTCVERHLAVVHPITYMGLRKRGAVRIRNAAIGFCWLLCFGSFGLTNLKNSIVPFFCISIVSISVVSFCSFSVLRALIRPGPGEGGGDRGKVDQSKMRAFHTISAITGALFFRFWGHLLILSMYVSTAVSEHVRCCLLLSGVFFGLPSSLVLPLLFLHRAGKLLCCRNSTESGQGSE